MELFLLFTVLVTIGSQGSVSSAGVQPFIVDGDGAVRGQFPYQVSVQRLGLLSWRHRCGGSLISRNWVLTTASCTKDAWFIRVAAGKNDLRATEDGEQIMKVAKVFVHPNFKPRAAESWEFDVAMLRTSKPFQYSNYVRPARLPLAEFESTGAGLIVTGWGVSNPGGWFGWGRRWADTLQVTVVNTKPCEPNGVGLCVERESSATPCEGDEGGAMVQMLQGDTFTIVGMLTRNPDDCNNPRTPSAAVRVFEHTKFIQDTMTS